MKSDYMQLLVAAKGICTSKIGGDVPEKAASRLQTQVIGEDALQPAAAFLLSERFLLLLLRFSNPSWYYDWLEENPPPPPFQLHNTIFFTKNLCSSMESVSKYLTVLSVFFPTPIVRASIERDALAFDSLGTQLEVFQGLLGSVYSNATLESPFGWKLWKLWLQWSLLEPNPCRNNTFFNNKNDAAVYWTFCSHKLIQGE